MLLPSCMAIVLAVISCLQTAMAQAPQKFALGRFENKLCRGKGRLQDCDQNPVMKQILAGGNRSIPVLISQLDETDRTKEPIEDFWNYTTLATSHLLSWPIYSLTEMGRRSRCLGYPTGTRSWRGATRTRKVAGGNTSARTVLGRCRDLGKLRGTPIVTGWFGMMTLGVSD